MEFKSVGEVYEAVKILYEQYLKEKETLRQLLNILYVKPNL